MSHRIVLQRLAVQDLDEAYRWAARNAPEAAALWLTRFENDLATLSHNPGRCPLARENDKVDIEVREFLYGRRPYIFRVIFTVEADVVRILRIRRAQRRFFTRRQIEEATESGE